MNLLNVIQSIFHNNKHSNGKDTNLGDPIVGEIDNDLKQRAPKDILNYNKIIIGDHNFSARQLFHLWLSQSNQVLY